MRLLATLLAAAALAAGCGQEGESPATLKVSAIPDQVADNVRAQHRPVLDIVCPAAGVRCEWVPIPTYEGVVQALARGDIHMAYLGGATFAQARQMAGVVPIVIRDVDTRFSSTVVVRKDSSARKLQDLRGGRFLFGNRASTSGHVMARYYLTRQAVNPETFFRSVDYSGNHDATLSGVASGVADAGVVNSAIALRALSVDGRYANTLRVLWESPAYI